MLKGTKSSCRLSKALQGVCQTCSSMPNPAKTRERASKEVNEIADAIQNEQSRAENRHQSWHRTAYAGDVNWSVYAFKKIHEFIFTYLKGKMRARVIVRGFFFFSRCWFTPLNAYKRPRQSQELRLPFLTFHGWKGSKHLSHHGCFQVHEQEVESAVEQPELSTGIPIWDVGICKQQLNLMFHHTGFKGTHFWQSRTSGDCTDIIHFCWKQIFALCFKAMLLAKSTFYFCLEKMGTTSVSKCSWSYSDSSTERVPLGVPVIDTGSDLGPRSHTCPLHSLLLA